MASFDIVQFRQRVIQLCPPFEDADVDRAAHATLRGLSAQLARDEEDWLESELPAPLAAVLSKGTRAGDSSNNPPPPSRRALFESVAAREAIPVGVATEHVEVVCRVLAEQLPEELVRFLRKHLPALADLFQTPTSAPAPAHPSTTDQARDLAGGRPGASHSLADADFAGNAHEHSIARSDDPHAGSKLSSADHVATERNLATGDPGAQRRLSTSR